MNDSRGQEQVSASAAFIAGLPAAIREKLSRITDAKQRQILLGCRERGEAIPDFAWKPIGELTAKIDAVNKITGQLADETSAPGIRERQRAYWRLDNAVCREFLQLGTEPEDFEAVKRLFPYIREAAVCETPRGWEYVPDWLYLGFLAGHELGCKHPELVGVILPGEEVEEAKHRLQVLQQCAEEKRLTGRGLDRALKTVLEYKREAHPEGDVTTLICSLILRTARAGVAAGTVALSDPALAEYVAGIGELRGCKNHGPFEKALAAAPWRTFEDGAAATPWHPLLRVTRELYPEKTLEGKTVLEFLDQRLKQLGVTDEGQCPTSEIDLIDWIAAGLEFGRRAKKERPRLVAAIIKECAGQRLETARSVVQHVIAKAKRIESLSLIRPLLEWHGGVYGKDPHFYGQRLVRVGSMADFAVWIPWLEEGQRKQSRKRKVRAGRANGE